MSKNSGVLNFMRNGVGEGLQIKFGTLWGELDRTGSVQIENGSDQSVQAGEHWCMQRQGRNEVRRQGPACCALEAKYSHKPAEWTRSAELGPIRQEDAVKPEWVCGPECTVVQPAAALAQVTALGLAVDSGDHLYRQGLARRMYRQAVILLVSLRIGYYRGIFGGGLRRCRQWSTGWV